jgi:replicative DNA helicase
MSERSITQVVMSSLVRFTRLREKYLEKLDATDFPDALDRKLFTVVKQLVESSSPVTKESLQSYFRGQTVESLAVTLLYDSAIPEMTDSDFAEFKGAGVRSRLRMMASYIDKQTKLSNVPTSTILAEVQGMVDRLDGNTVMGLIEPEQAVENTINKIRKWAESTDEPVKFGIPEVDARLFLNRLEGFVVMAAPPSLGKTTMLCQMLKANVQRGVPCLFFTLEMSTEDIYLKLAQGEPELRGMEISSSNLQRSEFVERLEKAILKYRTMPLYIYDNIRDINVMVALSRKLSVSRGVRLTALDYIQLAQSGNESDNDVVRVSKVSEKLKLLSRADATKGYPAQTVIGLSQYNAEGQNAQSQAQQARGGQPSVTQRRRLSGVTMRWSGQVRQDADILAHLYTEDDIDNPTPEVNIFFDKYRFWRRGWEVSATFVKDRQQFLTQGLTLNQSEEVYEQQSRMVTF